MFLAHSYTAQRLFSTSNRPSQWAALVRSVWMRLIEAVYEAEYRHALRQIERHQMLSNRN
jgi:hypothetical protein